MEKINSGQPNMEPTVIYGLLGSLLTAVVLFIKDKLKHYSQKEELSIADRREEIQQIQFLRQLASELQLEVIELRQEVAALRQRVEELEDENLGYRLSLGSKPPS